MKTISRYIMTLALLLTAVTGAWAQGPVDGTIAWPVGNEASATVSASIKDAISSTGVTTGSGLTVSNADYFDTDMMKYQPATANAGNVEGVMIEYTIEAVDGYKFKPTGVDYAAVKDGTDNASYSWSYTIDGVESAITDVSMSDVLRSSGSNSATAQLMHSESITADGCSVFTLRFYISNCSNTKKICIGNITISGSVSAAAPTGPEIAWDKTTKTGTFTMPAFDVEIAPIYAPVAQWAEVETVKQLPAALEGIIAGQDAAIVTAGQSAQGTVMYAVTTSAEAAPALTAFSATVPTAKDYDDAATVYVWYYIQGADTPDGQEATEENTFNDSEICAEPIKVTVLTNKFDLTLKAANANTIEAGKATVTVGGTDKTVTEGKLQGVKMGSEVKVKANTGYKLRKVEVKKKAAPALPALNITNPVVGQVIGSDGKNYAYGSLPTGVTAVAKICYVSGSNGLALALNDEGFMEWSTAQTTCAAHTPAFTGGTWKLATKDEWNSMINAAGSDNDLRDGFSSVGGKNMELGSYWSSTEDGSSYMWYYLFIEGIGWSSSDKENYFCVRACLAF